MFYEYAKDRSIIVDPDVVVPSDADCLKPHYSYFVIIKPDSGEVFDLFVIEAKAVSN